MIGRLRGPGVLLAFGLWFGRLAAQDATTSAPIADNSFLIEEAYNQDPGVVQHINTFTRPDGGGAWAYSFTQEWPFRGRTHQLSYSVPVLNQSGGGTGLGDVALNYRYQLVADGDDGVHVAPRLSLLLPTGDERRGRGAGGSACRPTSRSAFGRDPGLLSTATPGSPGRPTPPTPPARALPRSTPISALALSGCSARP